MPLDPIIHIKPGDDTGRRRLSRQVAKGDMIPLGQGLYLPAEIPNPDQVILAKWTDIITALVPDAVITDRTAIESQPTPGPKGQRFAFVSAPQGARKIEIGKLVIDQRNGPGPTSYDLPFFGGMIAGPARTYLDNMAASRARSGPARTIGPAGVEGHLEGVCASRGESHLNALRDEARLVFGFIGREKEFKALDSTIGGLLQSRKVKMRTRTGAARAAGRPVDEGCLARLDTLRVYLAGNTIPEVPDPNKDPFARQVSCFFEAYFSNYIEGTRFLVGEAKEIVFDNKIPLRRAADSHDVKSTFSKLYEQIPVYLDKMTPESFIDSLRQDHADMMAQRPEIGPGAFKSLANQAGSTVFVAPEKVLGTLMGGFEAIKSTRDPFSRALMAHFLISDVHPFDDGNGRMSRVFMSRELVSHGLSHVVVPTVFRGDYLDAVRLLTRQNRPDVFVRSIQKCQSISAACASMDFDAAMEKWASTYAFLEADAHARLEPVPETPDVVIRNGLPAPRSYWAQIDYEKDNPTRSIFDR